MIDQRWPTQHKYRPNLCQKIIDEDQNLNLFNDFCRFFFTKYRFVEASKCHINEPQGPCVGHDSQVD
jgi:hypothetical protein